MIVEMVAAYKMGLPMKTIVDSKEEYFLVYL